MNQSNFITTCADIGKVITATMSSSEINSKVKLLSVGEKYNLVKNHFIPSPEYIFPNDFMNGCNRSFNCNWLKRYTWLVYSPTLDGVFCIHCALFVDNRDSNKGSLVNRPFTKWTKLSNELNLHDSFQYHVKSMVVSNSFVNSIEHVERTLPCILDKTRLQRIDENRHILKFISKAVLFCGQQCIALRGDNEDITTAGNPGNFLAILNMLSEQDPILKKHLNTPRDKSAQYISPRSQNEIIEILAKMVLEPILKEVREAKLFALMADEATSHNLQHLSICIRFVDSNKNVREEFLKFVHMDRVTGETISTTILRTLEDLQLDVTNLRGQTYDGAAAMASETLGVQKRIREIAPLAIYSHCANHSLNLVLVHSCQLPAVRNTIDSMKEICRFFNNSPKREGLLKCIVLFHTSDDSKRKPLLNLCVTRWAERNSAYSHFYDAYVFMVTALEVIAYNLHQEDGYNPTFVAASWDTNSKKDACGLLGTLTRFDFIVSFVTVYFLLSHMDGISIKLQSSSADIFDAYEMVEDIISTYEKIRTEITQHFHAGYLQASRLSSKLGVEETMPRIANRQIHRANSPSPTPEEYFRLNLAIPFLDHIITCLRERFTGISKLCGSFMLLVPSVLMSKNNLEFTTILNTYSNDLPSPHIFPMELLRWKTYLAAHYTEENMPQTAASAIKVCDKTYFPNIFVLLQLASTFPVTSCECERSFSALRRLHNFTRASMGQSRLSNLALLHIHYDDCAAIDIDCAINQFANLHPRRMELNNIIYQ